MSVYFIREGDLIKIGYSAEVDKRAATIIKGLNGRGELLGSVPGDRSVEAYYHSLFAADREFGEWFRITDRLLAFIQTIGASLDQRERRPMKPSERLLLQEERYAEEAAYYIQTFFKGIALGDGYAFRRLAQSTSISTGRLEAIYSGDACPVTAGEYVVLRLCHDSLGLVDQRDRALAEADTKDIDPEGKVGK